MAAASNERSDAASGAAPTGLSGLHLQHPLLSPSADEPPPTAGTKSTAGALEGFSILQLFYVLWLTGILVLAACVGWSCVCLWRTVTAERLVTDQSVLELLEDCRQAMGVRAPVALMVTDKTTTPALFGFIRPRLLLPPGVLESLDHRELRHVFMHELAHLRRHDVLLGWAMCLLQVVHWCNPLVWLAASRRRADRELACDALALSVLYPGDEARAYGNTILRLLERFSSPRCLPILTGILEDHTQLERRVTMISRYRPRDQRMGVAGLAVVLLLSAFVLTDAPAQTSGQQKSDAPAANRQTPPAPAAAPQTPPKFSHTKVYTIVPGVGLEIIGLGDKAERVEQDANKRVSQVVVYAPRGAEVLGVDQLPEGSVIDERGHIVDRTDWPFVDDPAVLGKWESVDYVKKIEDFKPGKASDKKLFLKGVVFEPQGKANYGFSDRTKGKFIHEPNKTAAEYTIKELDGHQYLFLEWKSGDYTQRRQKPWYYVLKKLPADSPKLSNARELMDFGLEWPEAKLGPGSHIDADGHIVDKVDYPFTNDPAVIGRWISVDFVNDKAQFEPGQQQWKGDLFLEELVFEPGGKLGPHGGATWTKGLVLHRRDKTASAYEIAEKNNEKYLFFEWKSGDYKVLHRKPAYYVLKKVEANEQ
ncbi:MAG TPA: M56 family metallopeptidase [Phycisphaerae bacterium]|nr:M56 family metallopeptidase [Phycisphaerae bacterium]HPU27447.1 M56 family metallopeptidase [Phycisphaerae bacterium]